jgi:hypothetical protein
VNIWILGKMDPAVRQRWLGNIKGPDWLEEAEEL